MAEPKYCPRCGKKDDQPRRVGDRLEYSCPSHGVTYSVISPEPEPEPQPETVEPATGSQEIAEALVQEHQPEFGGIDLPKKREPKALN